VLKPWIQWSTTVKISKSQTFPEGKGVETPQFFTTAGWQLLSQTFPEGKGVETIPGHAQVLCMPSSRRPSQKVKVLKPEVSTDFRPCIAESQTFPEGKGVETRSSSLLLQPTRPGRRPSQKVKVLKRLPALTRPLSRH